MPAREQQSPVSFFEFWPGWLFYTPVVAHWIALGLRYGDMLPADRRQPAHHQRAGCAGNRRLDILDQVGAASARWLVAPTRASTLCRESGRRTWRRPRRRWSRPGSAYPLVAKPDIGCNGTGVRLIARPPRFAALLQRLPARRGG